MRPHLSLGLRRLLLGAALLLAPLSLRSAAADTITIDDGAMPAPARIPFTCVIGSEDTLLWSPAMGFVYRNVEAFELTPGDTIAFDLQMPAGGAPDLGFRPQLDIALAHAPDPALPFKPAELPGSDFTLVADNAIAASAGNQIAQDYELAFTVDKPYSFPGGGLIIRVSEPQGTLATKNFLDCLFVITSDQQPSGTNRLVGTFRNDEGEYPWSEGEVTVDPFVPYVRILATRCGDGRVSGVEQCDFAADPDDPFCSDTCVLTAVAKGSGCDAGEGAGGIAALLLLAALLVRRRRLAPAGGAAVALVVALSTGKAHAQMRTDGFRVDRFEMAPSVDDGLILQDPSVLANLVWSVNATLGFTNTVLRVVPEVSSDTGVDVVGPRLSAYLDFAIGFRDRFEVNVALPFAVVQATESGMAAGYTLRDAGTSAVGDGKLGGSVLLYGRPTGLQLGLAAALTVPIGSERSFTGDGGVGGEGHLMASFVKPRYRFILNGGVRLRPEADYVTSDQGTELIGRAGVIVPFAKQRLNASLELDVIGRASGSDAYRELGMPVLALLGARYHFSNGVRAGAGFGLGLTEAPGSPTIRSLITVGYSPEPKVSPKTTPPSRFADTDKDGILDMVDRCPYDAEDFNGVEDLDGCPELDKDPERLRDHAPDPLTLEQVITLPAPIEFEFDTAIMLPGAETYLQQVLVVLKQHPEVKKLEIQGHTSSEGGAEYNLRLSNARATAVFDWLVERGIDASRLVPHGYGLTQPLVPNDSEANRQRNRRVQFRLVERPTQPSPSGTSPADILEPKQTKPVTPTAPATTAPAAPAPAAPARSSAPAPAAPAPASPRAPAPAPAAPATPTRPASPSPSAPAAAPAAAPAK